MKKFEKHLKDKIEEYKKTLGLGMQNISVKYDKTVSYMECNYTYPYINTTIKYSDNAIKDFKDNEFDNQAIMHELCHIITDPLYAKAVSRYIGKDEIEDERERLTDTISTLFYNLIK